RRTPRTACPKTTGSRQSRQAHARAARQEHWTHNRAAFWPPSDFAVEAPQTRRIDLFLARLLVEARFQRRAGLEARVLRRGDLDFLAGRRIAPFSGGALAHREGAESHETHLLALLQGLFDAPQHRVQRRGGRDLGQFRFRRDMIDELKLVHYGLSVPLWPLRSNAALGCSAPILKSGAFRRRYDAAPRAATRSPVLPREGAHRRPRRIDSRVRPIARRFAHGTQAFAGNGGKKTAVLPPKIPRGRKKSREFRRIRGSFGVWPGRRRRKHWLPAHGAIGGQCATRPWPSSSGGLRGGAAATSSSHTIGLG